MNPTMAAGNRTLSRVEGIHHPTSNGGFACDLLDLYGEAMDEALGMERTSLSAMVQLESCALETCERLTGDLLGTSVSVVALCVRAQLSWLTLMAEACKSLMAVAVPFGVLAAVGDGAAQASAGLLDHRSMDVVIGEGSGDPLPGAALSIASGGQVRLAEAEAPERGMDVVIGDAAA